MTTKNTSPKKKASTLLNSDMAYSISDQPAKGNFSYNSFYVLKVQNFV